MKFLSDYIEQAQTNLFKKKDAFFAFNNEQFNKQKTEGQKYVALNGGLICRKGNVKELIEGLDNIYQAGIAQDLAENGKRAVIERELYNHEAFYTWEIQETIDALEGYGITKDEVREVFRELQKNIT